MADTNSYRKAGVSIDAGNALVGRILPRMQEAAAAVALPAMGGFAAAVRLPPLQQGVLVACADGVGTKTSLLAVHHRPLVAGQDVVAMCVNDLICTGAVPLFFLDYYACDSLDRDFAAQVIEGVMAACELAGCVLIGGETAEMPGVYLPQKFDLAGFAVGVAEEAAVRVPCAEEGDALVGLASSGVHSNGYSLVRRILESHTPPPEILESLLLPTRIYCRSVAALRAACDVRGVAHITGGGLPENLPRALPAGLTARIHAMPPLSPVFAWLQEKGEVPMAEMHRVYNCGVGMVAVVAAAEAEQAVACLQECGETAWVLGTVTADGDGGVVL